MDIACLVFIILAFCGVVTEHTALIICLVYFILYFLICIAKAINE